MKGMGATMVREPDVNMSRIETPENCCHHYWVIETPDGPKSRGVCRLCGKQKEFSNSIPYKSLNARRPAAALS